MSTKSTGRLTPQAPRDSPTCMVQDNHIEPRMREAITALENGDIVAVPTETVYGLAVDAGNPDAIGRLFAAKRRPGNVPLPMALGDPSWLRRHIPDAPPMAEYLANRFWPGPLTLVVPVAEDAFVHLQDPRGTLALRVPDHALTLSVLRGFNRPVALTSANLHGEPDPTNANEVRHQFSEGVAAILDGGDARLGVPSTILEILESSPPRILRPGALSAHILTEAITAFAMEQT